MNAAVYRFTFKRNSDCAEAEATLHLALFAVEGLFGQARVRLDANYHVDQFRRAMTVDGTTEVGAAVVRVFANLLLREFGGEAFEVRRVATELLVAANTTRSCGRTWVSPDTTEAWRN